MFTQKEMSSEDPHSTSDQSEGSLLDLEKPVDVYDNVQTSSSQILPSVSAGHLRESNNPFFLWSSSTCVSGPVNRRTVHFRHLRKDMSQGSLGCFIPNKQAKNLLELMTIRALHNNVLHQFSLGTAVGFRIRQGVMTDIPAILVFVARKVHRQWLTNGQCLPSHLEGPGGTWCDVDVVEFSYCSASASSPKEPLHSEFIDGLSGSDPCIGSGSQVSSKDVYGTLSAIVKSTIGNQEIGLLTNRHVALDLDYPCQKMFHPLPPNLGPGMYLGSVTRAASSIDDLEWYGIYASTNPETHSRADGAFVPFDEEFDISLLRTSVKGVGQIGKAKQVELVDPVGSVVGKHVMKVGRSSGMTTGTIMAYGLEFIDEKGICFLTDFLIVGEDQQIFNSEGDNGSLILLPGEDNEKPRPLGVIWGGTASRGHLKYKNGEEPRKWTCGVDLGRLVHVLKLDLITSGEDLQEALSNDQRNLLPGALHSMVVESFSADDAAERTEEMPEPFDLHLPFPSKVTSDSGQWAAFNHVDLNVNNKMPHMEEYQFIPGIEIVDQQDHQPGKILDSTSLLQSAGDEDFVCISLQLSERDSKRQRSCHGDDNTC